MSNLDSKSQAWKARYELPVFKKLDIKVDLQSLQQAFQAYSSGKLWDSLGSEYASLCETHTRLPKMFFKPNELEGLSHICDLNWKDASYKQLSLTEFNPAYNLEQRKEKSGSVWDQRIAKKKESADERFFNKIKSDVPITLSDLLKSIKGAHRARFAQLAPHSQVKPHIDYDTLYGIRLHIALSTNEKCKNGGWNQQGQEESTHIPADGSVWFINPGVKHYAINDGTTERTHLIISVDSQELVLE